MAKGTQVNKKNTTSDKSVYVTTSMENKRFLEQKRKEYEQAKWDYENSLLAERDFEEKNTAIEKLQAEVAKLESSIGKYKKDQSVKDREVLEKWVNALHEHLLGKELLDDELLDEMYKDLKKI